MKDKKINSTRFRLLVYERLFQMWFWPSLLLFIATTVLFIIQPGILGGWLLLFFPVNLIAACLMIYSLLARFTTYIQAHTNTLIVKAPFFRLLVSYGRINIVRTSPFKRHFPPEALSWAQRRLAKDLYGKTCTLVELKGYPLPRRTLKVMLGRFLLPMEGEGLVLLVEDWLQLSNEIAAARAEWVGRRLIKREKRTVEKILRG